MSVHTAPEFAAAPAAAVFWPVSSSKQHTRSHIKRVCYVEPTVYCNLPPRHASMFTQLQSINSEEKGICQWGRETTHEPHTSEEILGLIYNDLSVRCHQIPVWRDNWADFHPGLQTWCRKSTFISCTCDFLCVCMCVCVCACVHVHACVCMCVLCITLALWFWNQTCTTRTLRPVSAAKVSLTLD